MKVNVRLLCTEKAKLQEDAEFAGMSMGALVRAQYFDLPIVASTDQIMIRELRRLSGLFKSIHLESDGAYSKETAEALRLVSVAIKALGARK